MATSYMLENCRCQMTNGWFARPPEVLANHKMVIKMVVKFNVLMDGYFYLTHTSIDS